jgi:hypothetical protein
MFDRRGRKEVAQGGTDMEKNNLLALGASGCM